MKFLNHRYNNTNTDLWGEFEEFFNAPSNFFPTNNPLFRWDSNALRPAIDYYEDDSNFFVQAEVPGFQSKEIEVELEKNRLELKGARKQDGEKGASEITFHRSVSLPDFVKAEAISAKYENGVLTVTIPKADASKPRRIKVKS
ncbi:MAG: Hsp20/alpha crystallin family protein [Verrucomicrobia bacterium]|nr:Hsp20/alpha crystallin family protein [Verrucomicrobiota bacterium]